MPVLVNVEALEKALGFVAPPVMLEMLSLTAETNDDLLERMMWPLGWAGFEWSGNLAPALRGRAKGAEAFGPELWEGVRGEDMPPEFVPFGNLGTGDFFGFFVPAPELSNHRWPIVIFSHEEGGLRHVADDYDSAMQRIFGWHLHFRRSLRRKNDPSAEAVAIQRRIAKRLAGRVRARPLNVANDISVPFVARGWLHFTTRDGAGVLAPRAAFDPVHRGAGDQVFEALGIDCEDTAAALERGNAALRAGYPGTAALVFNEAAACKLWDDAAFAATFPRRVAAYRALKRPLLVRRLKLSAAARIGTSMSP